MNEENVAPGAPQPNPGVPTVATPNPGLELCRIGQHDLEARLEQRLKPGQLPVSVVCARCGLGMVDVDNLYAQYHQVYEEFMGAFRQAFGNQYAPPAMEPDPYPTAPPARSAIRRVRSGLPQPVSEEDLR